MSLLFDMLSRFVPDSSVGKESTCNAGDPGLIPGLGRSPGEENGYPLQFRNTKRIPRTVPGVTKSRTQLSNFHFRFLEVCHSFASKEQSRFNFIPAVTVQ